MLGALVRRAGRGDVLLLKPTFHADQLFGGLVGLGSGVLAGMAYFSVRELGARGEPETRTVFYFSLVSSVGAASGWLSAKCTPSTCAAA
jgi:drug/metabolite transporter (DMT)-like permease